METTPGKRIQQWREFKGLTLSQVSRESGIKVTTLSTAEQPGASNPSFDTLSKLLAAYPDLNPDWLLMGTGTMLRDGIALTSVKNPFNSKAYPAGGVRAKYNLEENGEEMEGYQKPTAAAPAVPQSDREFIDLLLKRISKLEATVTDKDTEREQYMTVFREQQHTIREQQGTIRFLQDQMQQMQQSGKLDGNQVEAPGYDNSPVRLIGFGRVEAKAKSKRVKKAPCKVFAMWGENAPLSLDQAA